MKKIYMTPAIKAETYIDCSVDMLAGSQQISVVYDSDDEYEIDDSNYAYFTWE